MDKACSKCGDEYPVEHYPFNDKAKLHRKSWCVPCRSAYSRDYYQKDQNGVRKKRWDSVKERRRYIGDRVNEIKAKPCIDCGQTYIPYVMDFDHRGDQKKSANISKMVVDGTGLERILKEIAKCDLVCSNCHRIRTFNRRQAA